jgi:predicted GTPase
MRGDGVPIVEAFFMRNTDLKKHVFSQENIDQYKAEVEKQKKIGSVIPLETQGVVLYDGGQYSAYIVESKKNGTVLERFWIDASRGYVCPLVQYYTEDALVFSF